MHHGKKFLKLGQTSFSEVVFPILVHSEVVVLGPGHQRVILSAFWISFSSS